MDRRLYTVKEAAQYLAIAETTLYHWISERQIPVVRLAPKAVRFDKKVLDQWIDKFVCKSTEDAKKDGTLQARHDLVAQLLP